MNLSKNVIQLDAREIRKPYTPPTIIRLELEDIQGGNTTRVLESTGGLLSDS